jgi:hypothetical protein
VQVPRVEVSTQLLFTWGRGQMSPCSKEPQINGLVTSACPVNSYLLRLLLILLNFNRACPLCSHAY